MKKIQIYDTTLRDGSQGENISFSVEDKLHIVRKLDDLGVDYIEGGWPGSNAKDMAFFERARELKLKHAKLAAFGSTCHPRHGVTHDKNLQALIEAGTPVVTIFGKSWDLHVKVALGVSLKENLDLIRNSVAFVKSQGREVVYDAEHFFDGYKADPGYALATLQAAEEAGADILVLCDTNGGTLTADLGERFRAAANQVKAPLGIHTHNDCDMAVANSIAAVQLGAVQVQGTMNGYGERCGNANLCSVIANLELKLGMRTIGKESLKASYGGIPLCQRNCQLAASPGSALRRQECVCPQRRNSCERGDEGDRGIRTRGSRGSWQRTAGSDFGALG